MDNMQAKNVHLQSVACASQHFMVKYLKNYAVIKRWHSKGHNLGLLPENTWQNEETRNAHHCPGLCKKVSKSLKNKQQHLRAKFFR